MATGMTPEQQQRITDLFATTAMEFGEIAIDIEKKGAELLADAQARLDAQS